MKKMLGEERRKFLLKQLKEAKSALTGTDLAKFVNVSRQVIVNDINLLKAKNEPIISTSQGYLYIANNQETKNYERKIVSYHPPEKTKEELFTIVDHGATVKNVIVEHPVYGEITANLHVSSRLEVEKFIQQLQDTRATLLSALTDGTHLHVIEAASEEILDQVVDKLREKGFIIES
jgi:uncharacterized protein